uniref:RNA 2',3'-cyclic phosphodiesterase n=1 Tax=uncultured Thiohalocapsa sp. TaxID=768990 RepID=UPI0025D8B159
MKDDRRASIRLFFALWPDDPVRSALLEARTGHIGAARATHPDDLHLTLVFIGDVDPDLLPCIASAGDDVVLEAFQLALQRVETWPRQRLLAAVPDDPPAALFNLVSQLQHNLLPCGIQPEPRPYRPHVTLARRAARSNPVPLTIHWPVQHFVLARSGVANRGYQILRHWPLEKKKGSEPEVSPQIRPRSFTRRVAHHGPSRPIDPAARWHRPT